MLLFIRRKQIVGVCMLLLIAVTVFSVLANTPSVAVSSYVPAREAETVILDAGHGGSDGGAVAADGTAESGINLAITLSLRDMLHLMGCQTVLTRSGESSLADPDSGTLRREKISDTQNRVTLINGVTNGILISIHQNMLPGHPGVHGAQVFYSQRDNSDERALVMQQMLNETVNPGNEKSAKPIDAGIFIMAHAECPALLIECGFLSNPQETAQLLNADYQRMLAAVICCGYLNFQCQ